MCTADFSLKLIAFSCLLIMATDTFVLTQIFERQEELALTTEQEIFETCYKP